MENKTIDTKTFKITNRMAIIILCSVVATTNTATSIYFNITDNTEGRQYERARQDKINKRILKDQETQLYIHTLEQENERLKRLCTQ